METNHSKFAKVFCSLVVGLVGLVSSNAAILVTYDFTGAAGTQPPTAVNSVDELLSATSMTVGSGLSPIPSPVANQSGAIGFGTGGAAGTLNLANNDYWEFTLTPDEGYAVSVTSITFSYVRATNGPQNLTFRTSLNGYETVITPAQTGIPVGVQSLSFTISGVTDATAPLTVRLYGYGATTAGSSGALTNASLFTVNGSVTAIPEPSVIGLLMLAGIPVWLARRKRA